VSIAGALLAPPTHEVVKALKELQEAQLTARNVSPKVTYEVTSKIKIKNPQLS